MNYYEHHIRDYDAATAHLTWDQDLAYTRLIRWYYRKEQPLPADVKEVCRLVRATTKSQKIAVASVLEEFFILQDNGWHHEVCDAAIEKFLAGEPERVVKKANENNRLAKHRDERARLFKALTDAGESAPWNIKIDELRALVARVTGVPETAPATGEQDTGNAAETQPATAPATPATATQTPIPNTQPPDTNHQTPSTSKQQEINTSPDESGRSESAPKKRKTPLPEDFGISDRVREWAAEKGHSRLPERFEHFVGSARANGYRYVDWDAAFMNAIRGDWAKLGDRPGADDGGAPKVVL